MQDANERKQSQVLYVLIANILINKNATYQASTPNSNGYFTIQTLNVIFEYLVVKNSILLSSSQQRLFQKIPRAPAFLLERINYLSFRLRYLLAVEGEDNLNQAKAFLQSHRDIAADIISNQGLMADAAGRWFDDISAYGYLYWAGDTDALNELDEFTNETTNKQLYTECHKINKHGLTYTMNNAVIVGSRHFDLRTVSEAAYAYDTAAMPLIAAKNWQASAWQPVKLLWFKFATELGKVPLWIAQLFCSTLSFYPLPCLDTLDFERTILFHNLQTGHADSWYVNGKPNPLLGVSIGIQKVDGDRAWGLPNPPTDALQRGMSDLSMLLRIHQVRMRTHPQQILQKLTQQGNLSAEEMNRAQIGLIV